MRELNSLFDQAVYSISIILTMDYNRIKFQAKRMEIHYHLSLLNNKKLYFLAQIQESVKPLVQNDLSQLTKFDSYLINDILLENIVKITSGSHKLKSLEYQNKKNDDLSKKANSLLRLIVEEFKYGVLNKLKI
ncbi:unnamed protein product (macronuclear) [Paramecium tetraurelia]|uniref:Uncharacterized protein n=1 Tax=Paramecium tetraurelia TaxID=5888 RepID=A0BQJ9_PARTE|nr:uncharacterized protein GSPATT00031045001 [Paramecium tetraurelia]CAK60816.1 unnamed protein product [Paramecium tetraurelia]|eukprot:XP_001428214.1 hypothetical protein (macronuclear) [Paramecium tetraurelia strain d4-2]